MNAENLGAVEKNKAKSFDYFILIIVGIAAIAGLLFGYDTGVISGALLFIRKEYALSTEMQEIITSTVLLGAAISAAFGVKLADVYGRRSSRD